MQVLTADEVLGTDTAYHKGIHTERLQNKNTEKTDPTSTDVMIEMDLIFDENLIMLISVCIPMLYTKIALLEDKKTDTIIPAIEKTTAAHKRVRRNVTLIRVDGEGGVVQQKNKMMIKRGVQVDKMGKRNHAIQHWIKKSEQSKTT